MASKDRKDKLRQYKPTTIRRLDINSGNECAHPNCTKKLIAEDGVSIISKICHITAASEEGPRYDNAMTDEQRRSYDNLILLCDEHHVIIDNKENVNLYTPTLLIKWKKDHEEKIFELLSSKNLLSKYPLSLNIVINSIGKKIDEVLDLSEITYAPNTDEKIMFNHLNRYKPIIREYAPYQVKLNKIYEEIEKEGSTKKELVLINIKSVYHSIKGDYKSIKEIRKNSDIIFDNVIEKIWEIIDKAQNKLYVFDQETINFCIMIIMVDAFMRCNILEEPVITV